LRLHPQDRFTAGHLLKHKAMTSIS